MTEAGYEAALETTVGPDGVIRIVGDIDIAGGPIFEAVLWEQADRLPLVLDLVGVEFVDSSGLRSLLVAGQRARDAGSAVVLRNVRPQVARLLEITSTESMFEFESPAASSASRPRN